MSWGMNVVCVHVGFFSAVFGWGICGVGNSCSIKESARNRIKKVLYAYVYMHYACLCIMRESYMFMYVCLTYVC